MPLVLLTRPAAQSAEFLDRLRQAAGTMRAVISPLTEIVPTGAAVPRGGALVLTSGRAAELAGNLTGRIAWCVGERTATLAHAAGATVLAAQATVEDLLALLLSEHAAGRMTGPVVHLRGADSAGDLVRRLRGVGVAAHTVVLYRAQERPLTTEAEAALGAGNQVIAPVFSPRGARILARRAPHPPALVLAISEAAAAPFCDITRVAIAPRPDGAAMHDLVLSHLGALP